MEAYVRNPVVNLNYCSLPLRVKDHPTVALTSNLCGPNSDLSHRTKRFPWAQENTVGFVLLIGPRSAVQLPPGMNTEFNLVFIGWAAAGETCCTWS